jgi:hypothetical protein
MIYFYRVAQLMNHEIFHRKYCKTVFAFGACRNYAINRSTRLHTAPSGAELFIAHDTKTISSPVRGDLFNSSYSHDMLVRACRFYGASFVMYESSYKQSAPMARSAILESIIVYESYYSLSSYQKDLLFDKVGRHQLRFFHGSPFCVAPMKI